MQEWNGILARDLFERVQTRLVAVPSLALWFANQISFFTPHTRLFGLRRAAFVGAGAKIHRKAKINGTVRMHQANVCIGKSWVGPGTQLLPTRESSIVIGDHCDISPDVMLHCGSHEIGSHQRRAGRGVSFPIRIGDGTWIGARATFLAGASVGSGCIVAAGSVVRGKFGDDVMIAGVPARIVRELPVSTSQEE